MTLLKVNEILIDYFYVIDEKKTKILNNKIYYYEIYFPLEKNNSNIALQISEKQKVKIILNGNPKIINCIKVLLNGKVLLVDDMFFKKI